MKTYLKFTCIYCGQHLECNPRFAGRQILCPACLHRVVIPAAPGGSPASQAVSTPCTWDTLVPMPDIEIPTRYRGRTATNALLAS